MNLGVPTARAAFGMCAVDKQFLVIFGGKDSVGRKNDIHIFDTGRMISRISYNFRQFYIFYCVCFLANHNLIQ